MKSTHSSANPRCICNYRLQYTVYSMIIYATWCTTQSQWSFGLWLQRLIRKKFRMKVAEKHLKHSLWIAIQHWKSKITGKQSLVRSLFCSVSENINQTRHDWENFNMAIDQKRYENIFSLLFLWNEMVLQLFTHIIYRITSALSIAVLLHTKNAVFTGNSW